MRLPQRLVPIQKTGASQPADHGLSCLDAFALGVIDDSCPSRLLCKLAESQPGVFLSKSSRFTQQLDQRLLTAFGDGEHVDLGFQRWHV